MGLQINYATVLEKLAKCPKTTDGTYKRTVAKVESAKEQLLEDFDESAITQEIEEGPTADNISGTLGGYGNLFSYIGFHAGDNPIDILRRILKSKKNYSIEKPPDIKTFISTQRVEVRYKISYLSLEDIVAQMGKDGEYPEGWRTGNFLYGIEHGIFGLSYYLYDEKFNKYEQSRSTSGLEAKGKDGELIVIRGASQSKPSKWISEMIRNFVLNLKRKKE